MDTESHRQMEQTWDNLCAEMQSAGKRVLAMRDLAPVDVAEGLRHMTRILRMNLGIEFEAFNPDFPLLVASSTETQKAGYDCPDYVRLWTYIRGSKEYRIRGVLGEADMVSLMAYEPAGEGHLAVQVAGLLETPNIEADPQGRFEAIVSSTPHSGNWLPMSPRTTKLAVRSVVHDRRLQAPARIVIEPLDSSERIPPLAPGALIAGLENATAAFATWAGRADGFTAKLKANGPNTFDTLDAEAGGGGAYPLQTYVYGYWELAPDEALLVEVDLPDCVYWNFHLCNHWAESLDYMRDRVTINSHTAKVGSQGRLQIVLAPSDTGHPNWVNVSGRDHGTMVFRFLHAKNAQRPETRVKKLAQLKLAR